MFILCHDLMILMKMATKSFFAKLQANPNLAATVVKNKEPFAPRPKVQKDKKNALLRKVNAKYFLKPRSQPIPGTDWT
jgi:hypothetical protein